VLPLLEVSLAQFQEFLRLLINSQLALVVTPEKFAGSISQALASTALGLVFSIVFVALLVIWPVALRRLRADAEAHKTRGKTPVAVLSPIQATNEPRPKVGTILGEVDPVPSDALAPISEEELTEEWGL